MSRNEGPPDWMNPSGGKVRESTGSKVQPQNYIKTDMARGPNTPTSGPAIGRVPGSVVTGVKIIAWLMLLNTCIGAGLVVVSMFPPDGTEVLNAFGDPMATQVTLADYLTPVRVLIATALGIALSVAIWKIVDDGD